MNEPKTFDELSLRDTIYYLSDSGGHGYLNISSIKPDDEQIRKTLIGLFGNEDPISLPDGETIYDDRDGEIKYTTDPKVYSEWKKPSILKEISEKEKRIESIKNEIAELKNSIGIN